MGTLRELFGGLQTTGCQGCLVGELSTACATAAPLQAARLRWCNDAKLRGPADLLPPQERQLLALWGSGTVSTRALAGVLGCAHGTLVRRLHAIYRRIDQPIAQHLACFGRQLAPTHREVALRLFLRGQSRRQIAKELRLNQHEVRRIAAEVRGWSVARSYANS